MEKGMKRRDFLKGSVLVSGGLLVGAGPVAAGSSELGLFESINRVKDAGNKNLLEKKHAPVIGLPQKMRAGEPFAVTVSVGEVLHPMSAGHYIEYVELFAGNEPAGRMEFRPAFNVPRVSFTLALEKPVTLVARQYCNLHGLWESRIDLVFS